MWWCMTFVFDGALFIRFWNKMFFSRFFYYRVWRTADGRRAGSGRWQTQWMIYICHAYWIVWHVYSVMPCFHACDARFRIKKLIFWEINMFCILKKTGRPWPVTSHYDVIYNHVYMHACRNSFICTLWCETILILIIGFIVYFTV